MIVIARSVGESVIKRDTIGDCVFIMADGVENVIEFNNCNLMKVKH
jgi:hypothetical protein